jgi:release factor glutamine methyltransferase
VVTITLTIKVGDWLAQAQQKLVNTSENPSLEAQLLVAHVTGQSRVSILTHPEMVLSIIQLAELDRLLNLLQAGEPLPYLLGHWEFYGLDFMITPQVLIPRPETELLVEAALHWLAANPGRRLAADVGTGSGCIAVSLSHHVADLIIIATDLSFPALKVARVNAFKHAPERPIFLTQTNLLQSFNGPFDLVCANLPYIPTSTLSGLPVAQHEPCLALDGGDDGLVWIKELLKDALRWLAPSGLLLLEIEAGQDERVAEYAGSFLPGTRIYVNKDLAGNDRIVSIERSAGPVK